MDCTAAPLNGIRVVELGNFIAAPTAGRLLADFGADVIKIERPRTGDELRSWRLHDGDTSMLYRTINRNKKSVEVDLRTDAGRAAVLKLVAVSDVVIENFRPGTLEKWGLGPEDLERVRPGIIISRISAFGQTGPRAPRPGFAAVAEAFGGFRELVGDPDRPPVRVGVSIGDSIAGLYSAFGVVMSLLHQRRAAVDLSLTQRTTDVALYEAMFSMMESLVPDYLAHGIERERVGGRVEGIAPSNSYLCADRKSVVIAGNADGIFERLMRLIGRSDLADDPALSNNADRWAQRNMLDDAIGAWTLQRPAVDILADLDAADVPGGLIYTVADIVNDPHYRARGMIQDLDVETGSGVRRVGFPGIIPVMGGVSRPIRNVGPDLGAHNEEILGGLLQLDQTQRDEAAGLV